HRLAIWRGHGIIVDGDNGPWPGPHADSACQQQRPDERLQSQGGRRERVSVCEGLSGNVSSVDTMRLQPVLVGLLLAVARVPAADTLPAIDLGAGVSGFITNKVGVVWDLRYFRSIAGTNQGDASFGQRLSFWRASMALALRY